MADTVPAALKSLQLAPFAKRAAQLERFKPIITYWRAPIPPPDIAQQPC